jgi:hypothetical protein
VARPGLWLGAIRDTVGGNLIVSNNTAADTSQLPGSDSTGALTRLQLTTTRTAKARHGGPSALLVQVNRDVRGCAFLLHDHVILRLVDD